MCFVNKFLSNSNKTDRSKVLAYLRKFKPSKQFYHSNNKFLSANFKFFNFCKHYSIIPSESNNNVTHSKSKICLSNSEDFLCGKDLIFSFEYQFYTSCLTTNSSKLWINDFKSVYIKGIMGLSHWYFQQNVSTKLKTEK